tara:strand:+ start:147 stop:296 length:150 start_codon:yes stop_codon:yes gene_type:complete
LFSKKSRKQIAQARSQSNALKYKCVPAQVYDLKQKRSKANLESSLDRRA